MGQKSNKVNLGMIRPDDRTRSPQRSCQDIFSQRLKHHFSFCSRSFIMRIFFPYFFQDRLEIPTSSYNIFNLQLFSRSYPFHQMPINRFQFMKSSPTKTLIFFLSVEKWLTGSAITCVFVRLFLRFQPIFLQNHRLDFFH